LAGGDRFGAGFQLGRGRHRLDEALVLGIRELAFDVVELVEREDSFGYLFESLFTINSM
jgi:hypothetical protein